MSMIYCRIGISDIDAQTAHNKQLSAMAVAVENGSLLRPMTPCGGSGCSAPSPPLRQAAERYVPYALLLWDAERPLFNILDDADKELILTEETWGIIHQDLFG